MATNLNPYPSTGRSYPEADASAAPVSVSRLWFQFAGSAAAWVGLGVCDMLISWRACLHEEQFGGPSAHPGALILFFIVTGLLFAATVLVGFMSYRTWQKLSSVTKLLDAEGRERSEFMSLAGLFISVTLGAGILWFCVPLFVIKMCVRWR